VTHDTQALIISSSSSSSASAHRHPYSHPCIITRVSCPVSQCRPLAQPSVLWGRALTLAPGGGVWSPGVIYCIGARRHAAVRQRHQSLTMTMTSRMTLVWVHLEDHVIGRGVSDVTSRRSVNAPRAQIPSTS